MKRRGIPRRNQAEPVDLKGVIKERIMNPLIEKAAYWGIEFLDGLKPETQEDIVQKVAGNVAGWVNSSETGIDNKAAEIAIKKIAWLLEAIDEKIVDPGEEIPRAVRVNGDEIPTHTISRAAV